MKSESFLIDGAHPSKQFWELYKLRLNQLAPLIIPQFTATFCKHINELVPGHEFSIVGVLYKELASRIDVLKEYMEIGVDSQAEDISLSEDDQIFIEDTTGRLKLKDLDSQQFPTGVVIGLRGHSTTSKFHVEDYYFLQHPPARPLPHVPGPNNSILFISDLECYNKKKMSSSKLLTISSPWK